MPEIKMPQIEYGFSPINNFKVDEIDPSGNVKVMVVGDRKVAPSGRFWVSLCSQFSNYGLSTKLFKLFQHHEVFQRLTDTLTKGQEELGRANLRYALEDRGAGHPTLLAVTNPQSALVHYEKIGPVLARRTTSDGEYSGGIIRTTHSPAHMAEAEINGDMFAHQYVMETPIDGFGKPLIYLSLLRQVCTNGAIGYARAFKTEIQIGKGGDDTIPIIERNLDAFNNEEGYAALRERFETAGKSWASVYEANRVYKTLTKMAQSNQFREPTYHQSSVVDQYALRRAKEIGCDGANLASDGTALNTKILRSFSALVGDLCTIYGLTQLDALSQKKMQKLPTRATVYDVINFTTEVATHYTDQKDGRMLQAIVGEMISNEYDMEASKLDYPEFQDWFVSTEKKPPKVSIEDTDEQIDEAEE